MKTIFKDGWKPHLLVAGLGILAGLVVILFLEVPDTSLFSFYYWSASTFGFWMFSTSLLVLLSETRKSAAIHAGTYIFLMFLVTTIHQTVAVYREAEIPFGSPLEVAADHLYGWLAYSIPAGVLCAMLGAVLWSGRKDTTWGKVLRIAPALFLLAETLYLWYCVFTVQTRLFSAGTDLACLAAYCLFLRYVGDKRKESCTKE